MARRALVGGIDQMRSVISKARAYMTERCCLARLWVFPVRRGGDVHEALIVSLTSFPSRIGMVWVAVASMLQQTVRPHKIILVLAEDEFPERVLPYSLRRLFRHGVEVLWTAHNSRSFKKLAPVAGLLESSLVITVDDDVRYVPWIVEELLRAYQQHPRTIIAARARRMVVHTGRLAPYIDWPLERQAGQQSTNFFTGVGGVLYPPGCLPLSLLTNLDLALRLCPTADDIWFWFVARLSGVPVYCLAVDSYVAVSKLAKTPRLEAVNVEGGANDLQLRQVAAHFGVDPVAMLADDWIGLEPFRH